MKKRNRKKVKFSLLLVVLSSSDGVKRFGLRSRDDAPASKINAERFGIQLASKRTVSRRLLTAVYTDSDAAKQHAQQAGFGTITPQKLRGMVRGLRA